LNASAPPTSPSALGCADAAHRGQPLDERGHVAARIEDRPQLDVDVLGAARRVVDVQHAIQAARFDRLLHRAVLARLVARHGVVMRHLEAMAPHVLDAGHAELPPVRAVRREDPVVGIDTIIGCGSCSRYAISARTSGVTSRGWAGTIGMMSC
jgi:hypothetical protein